MTRETPSRDAYVLWQSLPVRASDMDARRHVNNGTFLAYFEVARRTFFEAHNTFGTHEKIGQSPVMVTQTCTYLAPLQYPAVIDVGLALREIRTRSFTFDYAVFLSKDDADGDADGNADGNALAYGHSTHAWLAETDGKSIPIPDDVREALNRTSKATP